MLTTRLCTLLGIDFPIMNAPMSGTASAALAAEVSRAGGFGMIGAGASPDSAWVMEQIDAVRAKTDAPFGVGFISSASGLEKVIQSTIDAKVSAVWNSFTDPTWLINQARGSGVKVFAQVQSMDHARKAVEAGADVIIAQGSEAGGHTSHLGTMSFARAVVKLSGDIPVVAAGGIGDGSGMAAALMLGAEGVCLGTRFVASLEWAGPEWAKGQVVLVEGDDTILTKVYDLVTGAPFPEGVGDRVISNIFTDTWHGREGEMMARQTELAEDIAAASSAGDATKAPVRAGGASGLIQSIEPASYILREIMSQAEDVLRNRASSLLNL